MTAVENCKSQLDSLRDKLKEANQQLKQTTDSKEKQRLKNRIKSIRQAQRSIKEQLEHLDPQYNKQYRGSSGHINLDIHKGIGEDFFSRNKEVWSDLEGKSWTQIENEQRENDITLSGYKKNEIQDFMQEACERLTEKQKIYINEYFNNGKSFVMIAEEYGTNKSTVCRVVKNGLKRIQDWVDAKISVKDFFDKDNQFDWKPYLEQNKAVISDRQRELLLLVLSRQAKTKQELAEKLNLHQSSVVRTLQLANKTVIKLKLKGKPKPVLIKDWENADVFSLALQLDMPLNFYYKYCFDRKERFNGLTRYVFEVTKRVQAGKTSEDIADEFGISLKTARGLVGLIKRKKYIERISDCSSNSKIINLLSSKDYVKLQQLITKYNR